MRAKVSFFPSSLGCEQNAGCFSHEESDHCGPVRLKSAICLVKVEFPSRFLNDGSVVLYGFLFFFLFPLCPPSFLFSDDASVPGPRSPDDFPASGPVFFFPMGIESFWSLPCRFGVPFP